ncbi:GIY-YIG endonuclease with zinc finger C2H2-type domain [Pacmanvirus A23]|uniref:GIY-YIG endonuclease with zinc finger C2H2-type domain n=1 Tax=Pacmanvirus A23 TaxID=1932881 RepID=UPI000A095509|nr:GIY-YIG endonuclease with zinc finger C2H2-type domain [Pacmanvirus A23]SIP86147.1 GIY-YIG endonuclease with zinc finger C2H2-type domain [Pacmanvirus A23]
MEEEIKQLIIKKGVPALYILRLPEFVFSGKKYNHIYKFGITSDVYARLTTHLRNLHFVEICCVTYFNEISEAANTETKIKRLAESVGERRNILGNTEILETCALYKYIQVVLDAKFGEDKNDKIDDLVEKIELINEKIDNLEGVNIDVGNIEINNEGNENNVEIIINAGVIDRTCEDCGKIFTYVKDLVRHKNRKTPCLIHEVAPENINNPNRCQYCNNIFSKKENLTRHLKICKLKK